MNKKYLLNSPRKVAILARLIAKSIDLFIVLILSIFVYPVGVILSMIYLIVCDSLQNGQSVGKKFMGLAVISLVDGSPCSVKQSLIRNLPLLIPLCFAIVPLWGWIIALLLGAPLVGLELYLLFKLDSGNRLGDVMADTTVMASDGHSVVMRKGKASWFDGEVEKC